MGYFSWINSSSFFNPFGLSKGFFQKIRSHIKLLFWHPCYYFFNTTKSTLICEKAMVFMYSKNIDSVFFSTWNLFNRNIYISFSILQHTISNILTKGILHYTAVLYFLYPATNVQSFPPGHVILQEKNGAFRVTSCLNRSISHLRENNCGHEFQDCVHSMLLLT